MRDSGIMLFGLGLLVGVSVATLLIVVIKSSWGTLGPVSTTTVAAPASPSYVPLTKSLRDEAR